MRHPHKYWAEPARIAARLAKRGFTLIELLVVISMIGMLASVVLTSLNAAREKAKVGAGIEFDANLYHVYGAGSIFVLNLDEGSGYNLKDSGVSSNDAVFDDWDGIGNWVTDGVSGAAARFWNGGVAIFPNILSNSLSSIGGLAGRVLFTAWIRPTSFSTSQTLVSNAPGINAIELNTTGKVVATPRIASLASYTSVGSVTAGKWNHVAIEFDGGKGGKIYINGKLDSQFTFTDQFNIGVSSPNGFTWIGTYDGSIGRYVGDMDNVRLYRVDF